MKEQVVAEISVVPLGTSSPSVSQHVAACLDILKEAQGIHYQLTAMGTIVEGPLERVLEVAKLMHRACFNMGVQRVVTTIKIDERKDKPLTIGGKVEAVLDKVK